MACRKRLRVFRLRSDGLGGPTASSGEALGIEVLDEDLLEHVPVLEALAHPGLELGDPLLAHSSYVGRAFVARRG